MVSNYSSAMPDNALTSQGNMHISFPDLQSNRVLLGPSKGVIICLLANHGSVISQNNTATLLLVKHEVKQSILYTNYIQISGYASRQGLTIIQCSILATTVSEIPLLNYASHNMQLH